MVELAVATLVYLVVGVLFAFGVIKEGRTHGEPITLADWIAFTAFWPIFVVVFVGYGLARAVRS